MCRRRILLVCLPLLLMSIKSSAQTNMEKRKFIIPPNDVFLLTVASQPDCPIQIENAKLLFFVGPGSSWGANYRLRNVGATPIRIQSITVSMWTSQGVGTSWQKLTRDKEKAISPGELTVMNDDDDKVEIVPLTSEVRAKMKLFPPLRALVVLMIDRIEFSDGSVYSNVHMSKEVQSYLQKIEFAEPK